MSTPGNLRFQLAGIIGSGLVRLLGSSIRTTIPNRFVFEEQKNRYGRVIFALRHGQLLLGSYFAKEQQIATIISQHRDGEYIFRIAGRLGVQAVRGSSTRGGVRALYQLLSSPEYAGCDLAITPDGPLGPAGSVKRGVVVIARMLGIPIVPVAIASSSAWRFNSWDRFQVPRPFSTALVLLGKPIVVEPDSDADEIERTRAFLEKSLSELNSNARERLSILEGVGDRRRREKRTAGRTSDLVDRYLDRSFESWWSLPISLCLLPFEGLYRLSVRIRNGLYRNGLIRSKRLPVPVISVGNLSVGGTGKTTMVKQLGDRLSRAGHRVAILTRGYGAGSSNGVEVVPASKVSRQESLELGDEPVYLASELPDSIVVRGRDRYLAGLVAIARYGCDVCILDDGFQYRRLHRDIDIVMMNRDRPSMGWLLPRGRLRETVDNLRRADLLVESRRWGGVNREDADERVHKEIPRIRTSLAIDTMYPLGGPKAKSESPLDLGGRRVLAFAGIGDPRSLRYLVEGCFPAVAFYVFFRDHHAYPRRSVEFLKRTYDRIGAEVMLTTEKDAVKLGADCFGDRPCWVLSPRLVVDEGENVLDELLALVGDGTSRRIPHGGGK